MRGGRGGGRGGGGLRHGRGDWYRRVVLILGRGTYYGKSLESGVLGSEGVKSTS